MDKDLEKALIVLRKGGVIIHPTDTCYGFTCDAFNREALLRLYDLKKMPREKPVSIMLGDVSRIPQYAEVNAVAEELIARYLPGALTIILPRKIDVFPDFFNAGHLAVGIRVPNHAFCLELCRNFGSPLVTTSANISGRSEPYSARNVTADLVIDGGVLPKNKPSTIVKVDDGKIKVLRQGGVIVSHQSSVASQ